MNEEIKEHLDKALEIIKGDNQEWIVAINYLIQKGCKKAYERSPKDDIRKWIKCDEQLPENSGFYWVCYSWDKNGECAHSLHWNVERQAWNCPDIIENVAWWIPLIPPPREGE